MKKKKFKKVVEGTPQNSAILLIGLYSLMVMWFVKIFELDYTELIILSACLIVSMIIGLQYKIYWEEE